jgi:hypothetical protein
MEFSLQKKRESIACFLPFCIVMKKLHIIVFTALFVPIAAFGSGNITEVETENNETQGRNTVVESHETVQVDISFPVEKTAFLLHRIPKDFLVMDQVTVSDGCKSIAKNDTPFLLLCKNVQTDISLSYKGYFEAEEKTFSKGFTAGRYSDSEGKVYRFFELIRFLAKPKSKIKNAEDIENEEKKEDKKKEDEPESQDDLADETSEEEDTTPDTIPSRERKLDDLKSKIILDASEDILVGSEMIDAENEPLIADELTVVLENIDTPELSRNVANDRGMIDSVSLWYQDGTPVLTSAGKKAMTSAISSDGKAKINDLNLVIPEGGERIYIGVHTREMLDNASGSAITAKFSDDSDDHDVRGYWSNEEYGAGIFTETESPVQYILANKVILKETEDQPVSLFPGFRDILKFEGEVIGGDDLFLNEIEVDIQKTSGATGGFRVARLRLRNEGNIIASVSGFDLTGIQNLVVGQCAGGDACNNNSGANGHEIGEKESFLVEAEIVPTGAGFSGDNSLSATIDINGNSPGQDGITWTDHGNNADDGVQIQWADNNPEDRSVTRIQNVVE